MNLQNLSIEQLQEIVDGAPEGATHYATNEADFNYYKREPFRSSVWIDDYWQSLFNDFDACSQRYIELSDIRAALVNQRLQSDFVVGDLVVVINPRATKNIFEVEALTHEGVFANECTAVFIMRHFFTFDLIRLATPAEKAAGRRIDALTVCTEEETAELFNTKHCSPRNYIKQYYSNVTDAQRLKDLDASVDHAKAALATFNYKPIPTDRELQQAEQIRILRTDRNVWCAMFFIAVVGYGLARWLG